MTRQRPEEPLPAEAQALIRAIQGGGAWDSALSTAEFAAIRSVGFEPVGQVYGAAVYNIGYAGGDSCPTYGSRTDERRVPPVGSAWQPMYTVVSGAGASSAFGPLVNALYQARRKAIGRMSAECQALGGHGIVGVSLTMGPFAGGGHQFTAIGTAVRAPGGVALRQPFTSDLSGQDFARLIMAGIVPVSLVMGISVGVRHDDWLAKGQTRWTVGNVEVRPFTELVERTRRDARNELMLDVSRVCADGVVIQRMDMRIGEQECAGLDGACDRWAEVTVVGTAITRFTGDRRGASLSVLTLGPGRRRTSRAGAASTGHLREAKTPVPVQIEQSESTESPDNAGQEQQ